MANKKTVVDPELQSVRKRQDYDVTPQQFVTAWQTSDSIDEVSEKLEMPKPILHARASNYRRQGVNLKKLKRSSSKGLNVEELNTLIEELKLKS